MKKPRTWRRIIFIAPSAIAVTTGIFAILCASLSVTSERHLGEIDPILRRIRLVFEDAEWEPMELSRAVEKLRLSWIDLLPIYGRTFLRGIKYGRVRTTLKPIKDSWKRVVGSKRFSKPRCKSLGFGLERCQFEMSHEFFGSRTPMILLTHQGRILEAKVRCFEVCIDLFKPGWKVQDVNSVAGRPAIIHYNANDSINEFVIQFQNKKVYESAIGERGEALGYMRPVEVPLALREFYGKLISSYEDLSYNITMIKALQSAGRTDLLWNVARGPNPTGRVLAIKGLQYSDPEGLRTNGKNLVAAAVASRTPILVVNGCIGNDKLPSEIINDGNVIKPDPKPREPFVQLTSDYSVVTPSNKIFGGALSISGDLSKPAIDFVVKRSIGLLSLCYERQLKTNPSLKGDLEVEFTVSPEGVVQSVAIERSTLNNAAAERCIVDIVKGWRFPAPEFGVVIVTYPFKFGPSGDVKTRYSSAELSQSQ